MHRPLAIEAALLKRNFSPELAPRIERLLDGVEDRGRLRCCNSGCYVCIQELLAVLKEVEQAMGVATASKPSPSETCPAVVASPPNALRVEAPE